MLFLLTEPYTHNFSSVADISKNDMIIEAATVYL